MAKELPTREPSEFLRRRNTIEGVPAEERKESLYTEEFYQHIDNIPVAKLRSYHKQARAYFDESKIQGLAETIKEHGIRQPLTIIPNEDESGTFEVVSGERRLRAAKLAGLNRVPCVIIHDHKKARELALIENLQREDLHPIEEGEAYKALIEEGVCSTQEEVAKKIGVPRSTVIEKLKLTNIPQSISKLLIENNIKTRSSLRKIMACTSEKEMNAVVSHLLGITDLGRVNTYTSRAHTSKLLEIRLSGDKIIVKKGRTEHLNTDILDNFKELLISLIDQFSSSHKKKGSK